MDADEINDSSHRHSVILRVGLTGNIGAGKTSVARRLEEHGVFVVDADSLGHRCMTSGTVAYGQILEEFGHTILDGHGSIDRGRLAEVVFADTGALSRLGDILHPRIGDLEELEIRAGLDAEDSEGGIAVTEGALLVETGWWRRYHRLVVVTAPPETRLRRLVGRGLREADARRRMESQMPEADKVRIADYVVCNETTLDDLRRRADGLLDQLESDLAALRSGRLEPGIQP